MPGKFLFSIFTAFVLILLPIFVTPSFAQQDCDLCGWCNQAVNPKPANHTACMNCLYNLDGSKRTGRYYTVIGCLSTNSAEFVRSILSFIVGITGGIAFLSLLSGSIIVLTSGGSRDRLQTGKDIIYSSIFGLFLTLFSVFILRLIGYDILRIPGFL